MMWTKDDSRFDLVSLDSNPSYTDVKKNIRFNPLFVSVALVGVLCFFLPKSL